MFLEKLEIQGFKSFAQKVTLQFDKQIASIVGPNGSGKSNVADSIRWVLGEQSMKTLRGKKSDDVIFAGSSIKSRLNLAEVSIYLNNHDQLAPIEYTDLAITRRIYRSGESEYLVNGAKAKLQDIIMLLARANVGQKSYSVIGQGQITDILTASPQERKEFFDEATGVKQYQIKRDQALNKLENTKENLGQTQSVLAEIEPHLRSLTRQVKRLERREELSKELKDLQSVYYSYLWNDLTKQYEVQKKLEKDLAEKISAQEKIISFQQNVLQKLSLGDTRQEAFDKLQEQHNKIVADRNFLLKELAVVQGQLSGEYVKVGKQDLAWLSNQKEQQQLHVIEQENRLKNLQSEHKKIKELLTEKEKTQQEILDEFLSLENKLETLQQDSQAGKSLSLEEVKQSLAKLNAKQERFFEDFNTCTDLDQLKGLQLVSKEITSELADLHRQLSEVDVQKQHHELIELQKQLKDFIKHKDNLVNEINELKISERVTRSKVEQAQEDLDRAKRDLEKVQNEFERSTLAQSATSPEAMKKLKVQEQDLQNKVNAKNQELEKVQSEINGFNQKEEGKKKELFTAQHLLQEAQNQRSALQSQLQTIQIEMARLETKRENLEQEIANELQDWKVSQELPADFELADSQSRILQLKNQLSLIGGIDETVVAEYETVNQRFEFLSTQATDLTQSLESLDRVIAELDEIIKKEFAVAFKKINDEFGKYFEILFNGGKASLVVRQEEKDDDEDEEEEGDEVKEKKAKKKKLVNSGIEIQAVPPGKKITSINTLSGGEKAMTAVALLCAIIANNPPPFVVLDEVDAALDEANSERFAQILTKLVEHTQFITITHNRATMYQSSILYGVTMGDDGISHLLSVKMEEAEKYVQSD